MRLATNRVERAIRTSVGALMFWVGDAVTDLGNRIDKRVQFCRVCQKPANRLCQYCGGPLCEAHPDSECRLKDTDDELPIPF